MSEYLDHKELDKIKESRIQRYIYIYHYICNYAFIYSLSLVTEINIIIYVIMLALLLDTKSFTNVKLGFFT